MHTHSDVYMQYFTTKKSCCLKLIAYVHVCGCVCVHACMHACVCACVCECVCDPFTHGGVAIFPLLIMEAWPFPFTERLGLGARARG